MQFTVNLLNLYLDIGSRHIPNTKTCSVYHWNQNRNKTENNAVHCSRGIYYLFICLLIFDYKALFVCVKDRTCLRIAVPAYCFNIFGSILVSCFVYLLKS